MLGQSLFCEMAAAHLEIALRDNRRHKNRCAHVKKTTRSSAHSSKGAKIPYWIKFLRHPQQTQYQIFFLKKVCSVLHFFGFLKGSVQDLQHFYGTIFVKLLILR